MNFFRLQLASVVLVALVLAGSVHASSVTIGPDGINSNGLTLVSGTALTGAGIGIGQVELERPGKRLADGGFDNAVNSNMYIVPADVFVRTTGGAGIANMNTSPHAQQVAGVIISTDTTDPDGAGPLVAPTGVAIDANLYSSATNPVGPNFDAEAAITTQYIATRNGGDIRAINLSFQNGRTGLNDGNQLYTQFIDWSAKEHNVLYVAAGKNSTSPAGNSIPTDNFNGVTVGRSIKVGSTYRRVSSGNDFSQDAEGDRTSIDLVAPGDEIDVTGLANVHAIQNGASFAAPHVTGTVALLQQYGDERILNSGTPAKWNPNARHHEVMKTVLMNSADKIAGVLGSTRTVLDSNGNNWLHASNPAATNSIIPLHPEFGAGHLNAERALTQFSAGEHDANGADVPVIGWDYGFAAGTNGENRYAMGQPLQQNSYISVTLTWDRIVKFDMDQGQPQGGTTGVYDVINGVSDTFETYDDLEDVVKDLNIFLVKRGDDIFSDPIVAASDGNVTFDGGYNLEHLFFKIPSTEQYDIVIEHNDNGLFGGPGSQNYGLAWWGEGPAFCSPAILTMISTSMGLIFLRGSGIRGWGACRIGRASMVAGRWRLLRPCLSRPLGCCC